MIILDLQKLYRTYFNNSYKVAKEDGNVEDIQSTINSKFKNQKNEENYSTNISLNNVDLGKRIFLPIKLKSNGKELEINCCTVGVTVKNTIVRTAIPERSGTVKELFSVGDYVFSIKGVLIGKDQTFPKEDIEKLRDMHKSEFPVQLLSAYTDLFMKNGVYNVAIESLDFPEVQGKDLWHRPFTMTCETDYVENLIVSG